MGQTNPLITDVSCRSYEIGDKTYWDYYELAPGIIPDRGNTLRSTAKFSVGESVSGMLLDPNERTDEKTCLLTKTSNQDTSEQVADSIRQPAGWASVMGIQTGYNAQSYDADANLERTTQHDTWDNDYYILAKTDGI